MNETGTGILLEARECDAPPSATRSPDPLRVPTLARREVLPYLGETRYMDGHSRELRDLREGLLADDPDPREAAVRLFDFVRDEITYTFGPWGIPASETLRQRRGTCSNKNTLLVALLRGAGIPAACGVLRVNAFEYFGCLAPSYLKQFMRASSTRSTHIYTGVYLDGRWVKCDPTTDREISEKTAHFCSQTRLVEWNGVEEAMDFIEPEHIHEDLGLMASIDHLLDKPARTAVPETLKIANDYLAFIRANDPFESADALLRAYHAHLGLPPPETLAAEVSTT